MENINKLVLSNLEEMITNNVSASSIKDTLTDIYMDYSRISLVNNENPFFSNNEIANKLVDLKLLIECFDARKAINT